MCRIGGIIYGKNREELNTAEIASLMFQEMIFQGPHAWGFATYNETEELVRWEKVEGRCNTKWAEKYQLENVDPDAKWAIFHSRYATHGSPSNNANNHPIRHNDIIGVHNGVLTNHDEILKMTGRYDGTAEVDSEAIFAAVNRWGPTRGMKRIEGNAVAVFTDLKAPHLLRIARTNGRTLHVGWTAKGNFVFASDKWALLALEPWVVFKKLSVVGENKILTLRNGQIIAKHQFRKPAPKYTAVSKGNCGTELTARHTSASPQWANDLHDWYEGSVQQAKDKRDLEEAFDRALARENEKDLVRFDRASRRGAMLFPKEPAKKERKQRRSEKTNLVPVLPKLNSLIKDEDGTDLFVWRDLLLTEDEYFEALEFPERYEHLTSARDSVDDYLNF